MKNIFRLSLAFVYPINTKFRRILPELLLKKCILYITSITFFKLYAKQPHFSKPLLRYQPPPNNKRQKKIRQEEGEAVGVRARRDRKIISNSFFPHIFSWKRVRRPTHKRERVQHP